MFSFGPQSSPLGARPSLRATRHLKIALTTVSIAAFCSALHPVGGVDDHDWQTVLPSDSIYRAAERQVDRSIVRLMCNRDGKIEL